MTCIVAIKQGGIVKMACDGFSGNSDFYTPRCDGKMFIKGDFIIGCTSSYRMIQLLKFKLKIPEPPSFINTFEYMCTYFIDSVIECFKKNEYMRDGVTRDGSNFLVAYKDKLFEIEDDFQVKEIPDYASVGCGYQFAYGSLHSNGCVVSALKATSAHSPCVCPPFYYADTIGMKISEIKDVDT